MKLLTFVAESRPRVGALLDKYVVDLNHARAASLVEHGRDLARQEADASLSPDLDQLLQAGEAGLITAREALQWAANRIRSGAVPQGPAGERIMHPCDGVRLLAPLRRPQKIIGIGLNYRDHCAEMGRDLPKEIRTFGIFANALIGPDAPIVLPRNSAQMDWEAELVAVIGRPARYVPVERALEYVAGYMAGNDVSARDHQAADPQTMRGKSGDTHAPTGPWLVTSDEIPDPGRLNIELRVNGIVKQSSNTSELVFSVPQLVAFLSQYFTLMPGDLVFTGTPAGVGAGRRPPEWLQPGDRIDVEIERIGTLSNICVAEAS